MATKDATMTLGDLAVRAGSADGIFGPRFEDVEMNAGLAALTSAMASVSSSLAQIQVSARKLGIATNIDSLGDVKEKCNGIVETLTAFNDD